MKPFSSGLYLTTMSRFAPKPPEARTTALALTVTVSPEAPVALTPTAAPLASVRISVAVVSSIILTPAFSQFSCSRGDHVGADGNGLALCVHRAMDALNGCTAEAGDVVQGDAVLVQPVDGVSGVCAQGLDQLGVVDALAADHGIQLHQLDRVEVAGGVGLIGSPLLRDGLCQSGDGLVVSVLLGSSLQGLLDAGRLAELVLVLIDGLAGVHAAGSADGVTAHHGLALEDDDTLALSGSGDGSSHACAACTDDDDVGLNGGVLGRAGLLHSGLVVIGVQAGSGQGSCSSLLDGGRR